MRVIFYTFLFIFGISFSSIILMPSLFDLNNYKEKIENIVFTKTNNVLDIKGNISLSVLAGLKLNIDNIIYKAIDGNNLFESKKLVISPQFFPLLRGELVFNSIKIIQPIIYVINTKEKKNNWEMAFTKNKKEENEDIKEKNTQKNNQVKNLNPLNIKSLIVKDAEILVTSNKKKNHFKNININFNYEDKNKYLISGNLNYKEKKIDFLQYLQLFNNEAQVKGNITGWGVKINNETNIYIDRLKADSIVKATIKKNDIFVGNTTIDTDISFSQNYLLINEAKIINNDNVINLDGSVKKVKGNTEINTNIKAKKLFLNKTFYLGFGTKKTDKSILIDTQDDIKSVPSEKKHLIDSMFKKLKPYQISSKIAINEVIHDKANLKNIKINLVKNKDLNIDLSLDSNFFLKLTSKSSLKKNKNFTTNVNIQNLNLDKIKKNKKFDKLSGDLSLNLILTSNLLNKKVLLNNLNGKLKVNTKNSHINGLNLKLLKTKIISIKNIKDLLDLKNDVFVGKTSIQDQEFLIIINNGNINFPKKPLLIENNKILLTGDYKLASEIINAKLTYDEKENKLLSLFSVDFKGNINNIKTSIDYNEQEVNKVIASILESNMKKMIKKNLDTKFNNILEDLLE